MKIISRISILAAVFFALLQGFSVFAAPRQDGYGKLMKDVVSTAQGDFITLHRTSKDKILAEYKTVYIGREILIGGAVSSVSDAGGMAIGSKEIPPLCLRVEREDSLIVLLKPAVRAMAEDKSLQKALERNYTPSIHKRLPLTWNRDSSAVVFDITDLVTAAAPKGKSFISGLSSKSSWFGEMKSFADNVSLKLFQNTDISFAGGLSTTGTISSTVSILLLPEEKMQPMVADTRIGVFSTTVPRVGLTLEEDGLRPFRLANHWRPGRKIVWYIDDSFPEAWKAPIREGVLAWNDAFKAIGLGNILEVRDFPSAEEDPEFDPDNLKYNCIRYVPNATMNAMGPSWVDPSTGEILCASVLVFNDVVRLLNNWRFVMTSQVDPRVRSKKMPQEIIDESLIYVISHEIGHTLGLMHNMAASSAYPVEKLRDPEFTKENGTTPSIMDYARFNYVAQPSDKSVSLVPPRLGVYDKYAIEWLYKPVPGARDMWEVAAAKRKLIEAHETDPRYRFSAQLSSSAAMNEYDPSARKNDLGDDPVKAGKYGISNLKYILPHLNEWISDDPDFYHRKQLYNTIVSQYNRYLMNALAQIGGIKLTAARDLSGIKTVDPVSRKAQREALKWVVSEVRDASWLDAPKVTQRYGLQSPSSLKEASTLAGRLSSQTAVAVMLSSLNGGDYKIDEYFDDLYHTIFEERLNPQIKVLQREITKSLARSSTSVKAPSSKSFDDDFDFCFGDAEGPVQRSVSLGSADEVETEKVRLLLRIREFADSKRHQGYDEAHYEFLYRTAVSILSE